MFGLSVMLITTSSLPALPASAYLMANLKVPVTVGIPETIPVLDPVKKSGKFSKVNDGASIPLTLNLTS